MIFFFFNGSLLVKRTARSDSFRPDCKCFRVWDGFLVLVAFQMILIVLQTLCVHHLVVEVWAPQGCTSHNCISHNNPILCIGFIG